MSLTIFDVTTCVVARPFGPKTSSHVWSSLVATDCPMSRLVFSGKRWIVIVKNPSMAEK